MRATGIDISHIRRKKNAILDLASRHGVKNVRVFGSVARGEANPQSDIDLLVDVDENRSLLDVGGFQIDMQDLLGVKVGVVTERSLHWYIRDRTLREAVQL